jgi:hypothetical protein
MSTLDWMALVAFLVVLWLFCCWFLRVGREAPKPKRPRRPPTEYERGYRAGWRRGVWW